MCDAKSRKLQGWDAKKEGAFLPYEKNLNW